MTLLPRNKASSVLVNVFLIGFSFIIAFGLAELIVRAVYKDTVLFPRYQTDARYGSFTLRKIRSNAEFWHTSSDGSWKFTVNSRGFRNDRDFDYQKPDGVLRVLSLGDSNTQGYEVRQGYTFSSVIEHYFLGRNRPAQVINAGVSGFGTSEALVFLENEGIKYHPDVVVLGFYANDFQDNLKADLFKLDTDGSLIVHKYSHIPGVRIQNIIYSLPCVKWLSENSYFYSLLFNTTWSFFKKRLTRKAVGQTFEYAIPTQNKFSNYQTELTIALIKRMYEFCQAHSIKFIIIDIPVMTAPRQMKTSCTEAVKQRMENYCDGLVSSVRVLGEYQGIAEFHVPHGHRHISEFSHTLLGVAAAKQMASWEIKQQ